MTEVILIVLIPCLGLLACGLCDAELMKGLLAKPPGASQQLAVPVTDAVRIDHDTVLTVQLPGQIRLWKFGQTAPIGEMQSHISEISCVAYSAKQRLLALGSYNGQVEVWDLEHSESPEFIDTPIPGQVFDCQFTPDGQTLLTAGSAGQIVLWDARTLVRRETWEAPAPLEPVRSLAVSADGQFVLAGTFRGQVQVWDLAQGLHLRSHQISIPVQDGQNDCASIDTVAFGTSDQEFIAGSRNEGAGIWNMTTGASVRRFEGVFADLRNGALSPDGSRFIAGTNGGQVITWNTVTGKRIGAVQRHRATVKCLLYSADGTAFLTGDWNGQILFHHN
ncbi:MAG: repeat-like protein [Planctomycetaceae bacterium]|nr:repeat-like protein [Planctomycetaceae bacterium]